MLNYKNTRYRYFQQPFFWFLFFVTIFLTLIPFFKVGLTNCDDLYYYIKTLEGGVFADARWYARGAGRFYFLITKPLYHVAYLIDNFYFTKIIQYGCVLLSFTLFALVVKKIFKQTAFALSVFLLLFVFLTVMPGNFMPIIAFPLYFTLSFSIFLLSILFLIKYYETKKYKHLVISAILSAIALLFYENYLIFLLFVIVFVFTKNISEQGAKSLKNKIIYKEIAPFIFLCMAYVVVYYLYRLHIQTENGFYDGATIAKDFNFSNFFKIIWNPNKSAFPTHIYHRRQAYIEYNSLLTTGHQQNFWYVLAHSQAVSVVNATIQCLLFCFLFCNIKPNISWKKIGTGALIAFVLLFVVNFLMAISEKYNAVEYGLDGYVTTYYSYFCVTFFIALLAYSCLKLGCRNKYVKNAVIAVFAFLFFCISIIIGYTNDHLSRDWQLSHGKHAMMKQLIEEGVFDEISDDAIIYMDNFNQTSSILGRSLYSSHSDFWSSYIHIKTNRKLNIFSDFESLKNRLQGNTPQEIYYITKYETLKSQDILLIMSKLNSNSINFENEEIAFDTATANEATVYYHSANKNFIFQFVIPQCSQDATVTVDNQTQKTNCGINAIQIDSENKKKEIISFTFKSDDPFLVKNFAISNIGFVDEETFYLW
jgi:hypothetical protein